MHPTNNSLLQDTAVALTDHDTFISYCRHTYRNRLAMLDELKRYDK